MSENKKSKTKQKFSIAEGLEKCQVCGEYKGSVKCKDLNWEGSGFREKNEKDETLIPIICRCDGVRCPDCGRFLMRRPISNYYVPEKNRSVHVPLFIAWQYGHCICKRQAEVRARKEQQAKQKIQDEQARPARMPTTMVPPGMRPSQCASPMWYLSTSRRYLRSLLDKQSIPQEEHSRYEKALDHFWEVSRGHPLDSELRDRMVKEYLANPDNRSCDSTILDEVAELVLKLRSRKHSIFAPDSWG